MTTPARVADSQDVAVESRSSTGEGHATATPRRVPMPRTWGMRAGDAYAFAAINAFLIGAMWIRHGNLHELSTVPGTLTAIGQLAALYGTFLALIQLMLISRSPYFDQVFGTDRLLWLHRWGGFATVWLLVGHFVFTTLGYATGVGTDVVSQFWTFLTVYPWVLWSFVALLIFVTVAISSVRASRRALPYETWYLIHLGTYAAIALAFMHQLLVGIDFVSDPIARLYWVGLYVIAVGSILVWRVGQPLVLTARHRFRVANVVQEAPDVVSIYITGRDLDRLPVRAGQWFRFSFLDRYGWWRSHPFSLSAAPNGRYLRITVKDLGDHTRHLQTMRVGTPVLAEGPYGILSGARRTRKRVLLIAGGIGITPLRALLEELPAAPETLTLIYRVSEPEDLVFREELESLARMRHATIHYLVGKRGSPQMPGNPFRPSALRGLVPDIERHDIYICGPAPMMHAVERALSTLGVPASQVHSERFAF